MREIKFRAWDSRRQAMLPNVAVYHHSLGNSVLVRPSAFEYAPDDRRNGNWKKDDYGLYYSDDNTVILMQYTGLKDKKGVEIYEGDIIKAKHDDGRYDTGEVVYGSKGAFCLYLPTVATGIKSPLLNYIHGMMFAESDFEVIGNLYENPELLKEQTND